MLLVMKSPLEPRSAAYVMTALLAAFLFVLAIRGFLQPVAAASGFGIALADASDAAWLYVKAGRDLSVGLMVCALLASRDRTAVFGLLLASLVIPLNDGLQVVLHDRTRLAYALAVHGSAVLFGVVTLVLLRRGNTR